MSRTVSLVGWKAHAALVRTGGRSKALPAFAGSNFRLAGDELCWIGREPVAMHPRAVVLEARAGEGAEVSMAGCAPWRTAVPVFDRSARRSMREGCVALAAGLRQTGASSGFIALIDGRPATFPYDRAGRHVADLAAAVDRNDAEGFYAAAFPLLGFGPGLTPAGDDFVGAATYARRLLCGDGRWTRIAGRLVDAATTRTHALGATLFRDLVEGESFASLHGLAMALARGGDAVGAARELASIGHSSGADMLAGFLVGAAGSAVLPREQAR